MKYVLIAGIAILIVIIIILQFIPWGIEPLTEVYFENHTKIPKHIFTNQSYNYSFSVHNLEYQKMNYSYNITSYAANDISIIETGSFILEQDESKEFEKEFEFQKGFEKARIQIDIQKIKIENASHEGKLWWKDPNYPEQINIHFWVEEIVPVQIIRT